MSDAKSAKAEGPATRAELWAWSMYDWANSAYSTLSITVLLFYITAVVLPGPNGQIAWGWGIGITMMIAAFLSPLLGAVADAGASKRFWLGMTTLPAAAAAIAMFFVPSNQTIIVLALYMIANLGYELSQGIYNGFLPEITDESTINRVSARGFAMGYVGGGIALALVLAMLLMGDRLGLPAADKDRAAWTADLHETDHGIFAVEVPNGHYKVTVTLGDPAGSHQDMQVSIGQASPEKVTTARGEFRDVTGETDVTDGKLQVHVGNAAAGESQRSPTLTVVNGIDILSADQKLHARFDFGTAGSSAESGSIWVLPTDAFEDRKLDTSEGESRFKQAKAGANENQRNRTTDWPADLPQHMKFGWTEGTITARDAVTPLRLRIGLVVMGLWWSIFSLPALLILRDRGKPRAQRQSLTGTAVDAFHQVKGTLLNVRRLPMLFLFLIAFLIFNDGVQTIITQAGVFAQAVLHIEAQELTQVVLMIQFVAWPGAILIGRLAERIGDKRALGICLITYIAWLGAAFFIGSRTQFWIMGAILALVMGGIQSVSRAIMGRMTPESQAAEFFGFFNLSGKATSMFGPMLFSTILAWTANPHLAILSLLIFFVVGSILVSRVNIARGQQQAVAVDREAGVVPN